MNEKNNSLQGFRGLACLMVFWGHAIGILGINTKISEVDLGKTWFYFFYDGSIAVIMFWVLGDILQHVLFDLKE